VAPLTDFARLTSGLWTPVVAFGFLLCNFAAHYLLWRLHKNGTLRCGLCTADEPAAGTSSSAAAAGTSSGGVPGRRSSSAASPSASAAHMFARSSASSPLKSLIGVVVTDIDRFEVIAVRYARTSLALLLSAYIGVAQSAMTFFSCVSAGGSSYVQQYPAIDCDSPAYRSAYGGFVCIIIAVIAVPFALAFRLYQLNSRSLLFKEPKTAFIYGAAYVITPSHPLCAPRRRVSPPSLLLASLSVCCLSRSLCRLSPLPPLRLRHSPPAPPVRALVLPRALCQQYGWAEADRFLVGERSVGPSLGNGLHRSGGLFR
jgi:hypothetical protein